MTDTKNQGARAVRLLDLMKELNSLLKEFEADGYDVDLNVKVEMPGPSIRDELSAIQDDLNKDDKTFAELNDGYVPSEAELAAARARKANRDNTFREGGDK